MGWPAMGHQFYLCCDHEVLGMPVGVLAVTSLLSRTPIMCDMLVYFPPYFLTLRVWSHCAFSV